MLAPFPDKGEAGALSDMTRLYSLEIKASWVVCKPLKRLAFRSLKHHNNSRHHHRMMTIMISNIAIVQFYYAGDSS